MSRRLARPRGARLVLALALVALAMAGVSPADAQDQARFLGREEITLYGIGLKVQPEQQTVPKGFATIVSTFLQTPQLPGNLPPFAPDAEVRATLRGPSFAEPKELAVRPNSPFNIPILTVPGTHTLENIRLVSSGEVLLWGSPQSVRIEVIERLLVTTVTARPLTADEIREKGIVFDKSSYQAYNFTAAFAIDDGSTIDVTFPVVLPMLAPPANVDVSTAALSGIDPPLLRDLSTLIPDTLQIQSRIPNLAVTGFSLTLSGASQGQDFYVPPIPGVIVIPGDIGFLNQFFSVLLMVSNVAPTGSSLVVSELTASIVLPPGADNVVGSDDDPLRMARTAGGETPRVRPVQQPGPDGRLLTGDDITTLGPGETGNAEYLVEGRREGTHVVEMELAGTLTGMPVGPVSVRGRAAGVVVVRNPTFTLTFTHPDVVNAGEPYTLDVTVTNTSDSPANFVSVNLFAQNVSGARLDDESSKSIDSIAPGDSASISFRLIAQRTGKVTAATLDSDEHVAGRFALKTGVGEFGIPLSPDSLVLPKEAGSLPQGLREAALGLLGRAWAVATAPPSALPKDLQRFSKKIVLDRAVQVAEAGFRSLLGEPLPSATAGLWMDVLGSDYTRLDLQVPPDDTTGLLESLRQDTRGFDLVRRKSFRGEVLADAVAAQLLPWMGSAPGSFHQSLAELFTSRPGHVSVLVSGIGGAPLPVDPVLVDASGRRLGGLDGTRIVKEIPFGDVLNFPNGQITTARLLIVAVPDAGEYLVRLARRADADPGAAFSASVAYPAEDGTLRFAEFPTVAPGALPVVDQSATDAYRVRFELIDAEAPPPMPATPGPVNDPAPTVLGAMQIGSADVVGCPQEGLENRRNEAGRVVAVLFSEEVTAPSVQDKLRPEEITAFRVDGNRVVGVALQPGRRIAYLGLREPIGRFVERSVTVEGATDTRGNVLGSATAPIRSTLTVPAGVVSGRILHADGSAAAFAEVRLFYEYECDELGTVVFGIASEHADADGRYQFDYVLMPPHAIKFVAIDPENDDLRIQRFRVARDGQRLNVNVVFLGRGTIAGRTLAEDGKTPLAGSAVRVTSLTDDSQYAATTDAAGRFEIQRVPVGNILVEAVNTTRAAKIFVSERIPFAGATITRDLLLIDVDMSGITVKTGTVKGFALRADGVTPVGGVPVVAYYANRSQTGVRCPPPPDSLTQQEPSECAIGVVTTDANGAFLFDRLTAGLLRFYTFDQAGLQEGQARITLAADQAFTLNLLMAGGFGTVTGVVRDQDGRPVTDAEVGGGLSIVKVNPADGTFTLTDVPVGRREIVAVSAAMQSTGRSAIDIVREGEVVNTAIVLEAVGAVSGIVSDRAGAPQAGIKVYVVQDCYDEFGRDAVCVKGEVTTDASGAYRVNGLLVGQYRVSAFRADMRDGNIASFAIRYHRQVLRADITFRGAGGTVTGRVLRARPKDCTPGPGCEDTPLPARVAISGDQLVIAGGRIGVRFEYVQNYQVVDNHFTTGEFRFTNVWMGPFTVRAAGQFSPEPVAVESEMPGPGQTVNVDLRLQPTSAITGTVFEPDGFTPVTGRQVSLKFVSNAMIVFCHDNAQTGESECVSIPQGIQEAFAVTDAATGRFSFPVVNAGAFTITALDGNRVAEAKGAVKAGESVDLSVRLLARARATIRVVRSDGHTLVPGATVDLQQLDYPKARYTGTAVDGTFTVESLGEGQFAVAAADSNGFAGRAPGRVMRDGEHVTVEVYLYDATGTVTGLVTRLDSVGSAQPVPNAEVVLTNAAGPVAFALTDGAGSYQVTLVPTGAFTVDAFDPVTAGRGRASGFVTGAAQPIDANIRLEDLGVIRGVVLQGGSLAPLKGWQVTLWQTTPSGRGLPALTTTTSVDGSYSFPGAAVGSFTLSTSNRNVVGTASADGQVSRPGQLVEVPLIVNIVRRVAGRVAGLVVGPDGSPAPNALVEVCPSSEACRPTAAGGDGRFSEADIPLGRFTVRARAQVTGNQSIGTTGGTVLFEDDTAEVTVTLMGLSVISGTVFEIVDGVRVPAGDRATVRLYGQPGSGCDGPCQKGTDANGAFTFVNVPARTFTITASNQAGQQGSVGGVLNPGETKTGLEILLEPTVSLTGRVLLAGGAPAAGIVAEFSRGASKLYAETDQTGTFRLDAVTAGPYSLFLQDPIGPGIARKAGNVVTTGPIDLGNIVLDELPPGVGETTPASGAIGVPLGPEIRVTFTEPINAATVNATTITLSGPTGPVTGIVDTVGDAVARFRLPVGTLLRDQSRYAVRISGVEDRLGKTMSGEVVVIFTTMDVTPPSVVETTPAAGTSGVSIETTIRVKYSEVVDPAKFAAPTVAVTGPSGAVEGRVDVILGNTTVVFTPTRPLAEDATYRVLVPPATDVAGLAQSSGLDFLFTTTDRTPPVIASLVAGNQGRVIENTVSQVTAGIASGDVAFVDFFINDTFAFTGRTTPFVLAFKAVPAFGGPGTTVRVAAVATDTSGNRGVPASTTVVVIADAVPVATITEPADGLRAPNGQRVDVKVRGTDDVGVAQIGYRARLGATTLAAVTRLLPADTADSTQTFTFFVPGNAPPGATILVEASVVDSAGRVVQAAPVSIVVLDALGPSVEITGVSSGERVRPGQSVTVVVGAQDAGGVARIGFVASNAASFTADRTVSPANPNVATSFTFVVPAGASSTSQVYLDAFAVDANGNRTDAARKVLPVADQVPPTVTLRTPTGSLDMVPGRTADVVVEGSDDIAVSSLTLAGSGAFAVSDSATIPGAVATGSHTFTISVPEGLAEGATVTLTARAIDWSGNQSAPATLTLTARNIAAVSLPPSVIVRAGEAVDITVQLLQPAASSLTVDLRSAATGVATVTPSVAFAAGATTATATVSGVSGGTARIDALIGDVTRASSTVTVRGGIVRGTVVMPEPVPGAQVTIFHGGPPISTTTDASGAFDVEGVIGTGGEGRAFLVRATNGEKLGYTDALLSVAGGWASVEVVLVPLSTIGGQVLQADAATAAGAGVRVDLFEAAHPSTIVDTRFTDDAGRYEFRLLAPGDYVLEASDLAGNRGRASASVGTSGQEIEVPIAYLGRGTVTGLVRDGLAIPVRNAQVELRASSVFGPAPVQTGTTGDNGRFTFDSVYVGSFTVSASDPLTHQAGSASGSVTAHGQQADVVVQLSSYGNLRGTVYRSDGATKVAGASVSVWCGGRHFTTATDADGGYAIDFLPLASFTVSVSDPGTRGLGTASGTIAVSGATVTANVILMAQGAVLVTVTNASGTPVNGASVSVDVRNGSLSDSMSGQTARLNDEDGKALFSPLMVGNFTARASAGGLSGQATGTITDGGQALVTIMLEPTGGITGTVLDHDGQTPATGSVRATAQVSPWGTYWASITDGAYTFAGVRLSTYTLDVFDQASRLRARTTGVALTASGQVETRDFVFVTMGTVKGKVVNPFGAPDGITVEVRSATPTFGGVSYATTGAAGEYAIGSVAAGSITVAAWSADGTLRAEAARILSQPGEELTVDLVLENNILATVSWLYDANDSSYALQPSGDMFAGGVKSIFAAGAAWLDIVRDGASVKFDGQSYGTLEHGGRETVGRQMGLHGLNVTRKFFVPQGGYFVRVLETLTNPTAADITVDVVVTSNTTPWNNNAGALLPQATSNGNTTIELGADGVRDHWVVMDDGGNDVDAYSASGVAVPLSFVFDGPGALRPASVVAVPETGNQVAYTWQGVTVPAGGSVTLMHFVAQQVNRNGAIESARRLVDLPPEALFGLGGDEIASIANFVVPAGGTSALDPLPALDGSIDGHVFEGDGLTAVPGAPVYFRSLHPFFGRIWAATADADGRYALTGAPRRPVPLDGFEIRAKHPVTALYSPFVTGSLSDAVPSMTRDVAFSESGAVRGIVRRHTGVPVTGGSVTVTQFTNTYATVPIGVDGSYVVGGLPGSQYVYTLSATLPAHPQGTRLSSIPATVSIAAGQASTADIAIEPSGRLEGLLLNSSGSPAGGQPVEWYRPASGPPYTFYRSATTQANGVFISEDMPLGSYTVRSHMPPSDFPVTTDFAIAQDSTTSVTLVYRQPGTLRVHVRRASGVPMPGVAVTVHGSGFDLDSVATDQSGTATVSGIPVGQLATVDVEYNPTAGYWPNNPNRVQTFVTLDPAAGGFGDVEVALPPFGRITGNVLTAGGAPSGAAASVSLPGFQRYQYVPASGAYSFDGIPTGQAVTIRTARDSMRGYTLSTATIAADGDIVTLDVRFPARATVSVKVENQDGSAYANASVYLKNEFYTFNPCDSDYAETLRATANSEGVATFSNIPEGPFAIRVYLPNTFLSRYTYKCSAPVIEGAFGSVVQADDGGTVPLVVRTQRYSISVHGVVTLADGETPWPNHTLQVLRAADFGYAAPAPNNFALTSASGEFTVTGVTVTAAGLLLRTIPPGGTLYFDTIVPVAADGLVEARVTLPARIATVSGQVFASDGSTPVAQPFSVALLTSTGSQLASTVLDHGRYSFASRPLGTEGVKVRVYVTGLAAGYVEKASTPIIENDQQVTVDLRLPASVAAHITGRVVTSADHQTPLSSSWVELLRRDNGSQITTTYTNADGLYVFDAALPADGLFTIRAHSAYDSDISAELGGAAAVQNATIDMALIELPVSVVTGHVRFADGQPVASPTVFAISADGYWVQAHAEADGYYRFLGLRTGSQTITAQDDQTGLTASVELVVASPEAFLTVDFMMPPTGTVSVTVLDENGVQVSDATLALVSGKLAFERRGGPGETVTPDENGRYVFARVPIGGVYVQGLRHGCGGGCETLASAAGTLAGIGQTLELVVSFQHLGSVRGSVLDNPMPDEWIQVDIEALGSAGPLGRYSSSVSVAPGTVQFVADNVPPGLVVVRASSDWWNPTWPAGQSEGLLAAGAPDPLTLDVRIGSAASFGSYYGSAIDLTGVLFSYAINADGSVDGQMADGNLWGTLYRAAKLGMGGNSLSTLQAARVEMSGRQLIIGPQAAPVILPLHVTRKVFVPANGRFARYVDIITNPTDAAFAADISLSSESVSGLTPELSIPSATAGGLAVFDGVPNSTGTAAYVFSGVNPPVLTSRVLYEQASMHSQMLSYAWKVDVPPHASVALLHFVAQDMPDQLGAMRERAQALVTLGEPGALDGLTDEELALVVNYRRPGAHVVNLRGTLLAADAARRVPDGTVEVYQESGNKLLTTLTSANDGSGAFNADGLVVRGAALLTEDARGDRHDARAAGACCQRR